MEIIFGFRNLLEKLEKIISSLEVDFSLKKKKYVENDHSKLEITWKINGSLYLKKR